MLAGFVLGSGGCVLSGADADLSAEGIHWALSDGLCHGGGACPADTPLAVGARVILTASGPWSGLQGLRVQGDDVANVRAQTINPPVGAEGTGGVALGLRPERAGRGVVSLHRADGVESARVALNVRSVTSLDCTLLRDSVTVRWDMRITPAVGQIRVPLSSIDPVTGQPRARPTQIVCIARDAQGPLLTGGGIRWEVVEGSSVRPLTHGLVLSIQWGRPEPVWGARVRMDIYRTGVTRLRLTLGEFSREMVIDVF